jgi:hypothetical protein
MKTSEGGRVKVSISLPAPIAAWLKCEAKHEMGDVSGVVRKHLLPAMQLPQTVWMDELKTVLDQAGTLDEAKDLIHSVLGNLRFTFKDEVDLCGPNVALVRKLAAQRLDMLRNGGKANRKRSGSPTA